MKIYNLFMTFFILLMVVIGCSSSADAFEKVTVIFVNNGEVIPTAGFHTYTVELNDEAGNAIDVDNVYLYLNMKMMNHPIEGTMERVAVGKYEVELPLAMAGEWYARISVSMGEETKVYEDFEIIAEGEKQMEYMKGYDADNEKN